ncbi:MAG: DNA helicase RecQ [Bacteroidales bacterium]|nr:DNA helicase RecQ [Bacteroidales bacterium]
MTSATPDLRSKLKEFFGYDAFKGDQEEIIKHLIAGNDAFVLMPTGGGKSLCYQLPALVMEGTAIVISPLISLMKNQVDAIRGFVSGNEGIAHFLNSSLTRNEIADVKQDLLSGATKILYVAPESLTKAENIALLKEIHISFYAVDEAHCISEWGHDFRQEYGNIRPIVEKIGHAPIIALTATATPKVKSDIMKNLGISDAKVFISSFNRPNLYYEIRDKNKSEEDMVRFIKEHKGKSGIIYCLSRKKVEDIANLLVINGIKALPYHAGLDAKVRNENQDMFLSEKVDVIVATIAFGMGIDKPDVRFVIHYDIPKSLEGYYQETGRAGRDGLEGICITYFSQKDVTKLSKFIQGKKGNEQEIGKQLLKETVDYAESGECRRKLLLNYFGESYDKCNCGNCDNCLHPRQRFDGKEHMLKVLRLVLSIPEQFEMDHIGSILAGNATAMILSYKHDQLKEFGEGAPHDQKYWSSIVHQGILLGLLRKDIDSYGRISVTEAGRKYLQDPYSIMLVEDRKFSEGDYEDDDEETKEANLAAKGGGAGDETLLAMLKDLRKDLAAKLKLQPWIIFGDPALDDMSIMYPVTVEDLKKCQGVGEGKALKYGKSFIELIRKYVEENDIERPDDFILKSSPAKSEIKIGIIQSIDKQLDLEDIAQARGMEMSELLSLIESIVESGTKLNLSYYIRQRVDDDLVDEIYDYFRNDAQSDSIAEAMEEFSDCDEEEVRLVRIRFLCEVAN